MSDEDLAMMLDGDAGSAEVERILGIACCDSELAETLAIASEVDAMYDAESSRILPMWALAAANPANMCSFECESLILKSVGFDTDRWSLLETAKANSWLRDQGTPLHHVGRLLELKGMRVERRYDASAADIADAIERGVYVIAVVDCNALYGREDKEATSLHAILIKSIDRDGDISYLDPDSATEEKTTARRLAQAWKTSGNYMVTASDAPGGYCPRPIDVSDIPLDADLEDLTEAIAENAHDIWARARMDEGWTYGPVRDDVARTHPDLVPYAQLPESEKEYDRAMAMSTLRLVRRLGYDITN